jgi:hypothetical protein
VLVLEVAQPALKLFKSIVGHCSGGSMSSMAVPSGSWV